MAKYKKCVNCTESEKTADELYNNGICGKCKNFDEFLDNNNLNIRHRNTNRYNVDFGIKFPDDSKSDDKQYNG